jgi:hypothetical protein
LGAGTLADLVPTQAAAGDFTGRQIPTHDDLDGSVLLGVSCAGLFEA